MTNGERSVLGFVYRECGGEVDRIKYIGTKVWDIGAAVGIGDDAAGAACDSLVRQGLLERGSVTSVRLTPLGRQAWERAQ